ncbi:rRNA biogenesis protein rrp5 [Rhizina undulata]
MAPEKKRKRQDATGAASSSTPKKSESKEANKRPKTSDATSTVPKPAVPSTLRSAKDEETSFPRGGASVLTPLEYKEIANEAAKDVLFETGAGATEDGKKGKKKKERKADVKKGKKAPKVEKEEKKDKGPKVEGLSFKRLAPGTLVLGCVSQITSTDIGLSLPNNLTGYIPLTSISEKLTEKIEALVEASDEEEDSDAETKEDEKEDKKSDIDSIDLPSMFHLGQYLRAYVVHSSEPMSTKSNSDKSKTKKRIELSLYPSLTNTGLSTNELVIGCAVQASVVSVEDHGLVMDLGLAGDVKGFLSSKELGQGITTATAKEGQVLLCIVTGTSSNGKIVKLSADLEQKPSKKGKLTHGKSAWWLADAPTIDTFLPGTGVEFFVTEVGKSGGIVGQIMGMLHGVIDFFHAVGWEEKELGEKIKVGSKIKARVISTFPQSDPKKVGLSILPHILHLTPHHENSPLAALPIATTLDAAKIINVDPKLGLFVDTGVPNLPGFVHISRVSSDSKVETLPRDSGAFKIGNVHPARVLGFNAMDGLFLLSTEKRVLDQPFLRIEDIKVGEIVKGTIERVLDTGAITVKVADGISGIVPEIYLSDFKLKNPEKKFRVGLEVRAKVISTNPARKRFCLALKKTLVNSDLPIISSYETATPGMQSVGTLIKILPSGAIVEFYGGVRAYLHVSEMSEAYIQNPAEHFRVGQSVNVHVISVDSENRKMLVSCKDPRAFGEAQQTALKKLKPGQVVSAEIIEKSNDDLIVQVEGGLKGLLTIGQLTDGSREKNSNTFKKLRAGQKLADLVVLVKNEERRLITLSMKPSLVKAAKEGELITSFEDAKEGKVAKGWIRSVTLTGVFVGFANGISGLVLKKDVPDDVQVLPNFGYQRFQSVTATITKLEPEQERFLLSIKPVEAKTQKKDSNAPKPQGEVKELVNPVDEVTKSLDKLTTGKLTKAKVLSVKETQINVLLADNVQGRIDVSSAFDSFEEIKNRKVPLEGIKRGSIIPVKVLGIHDARNHRFLPITHKTNYTKTPIFELTAKTSEVQKEGLDMLTLDKVTPGSTWVAYVNNHSDECIWVNITPDIRGRIRLLELSDDVSQLKNLEKGFPIGSAIKCHVLSVDASNNRLDLSARSASAKNFTFESLTKGMVVPGRVTKILDRQVIVQLSNSISGPIGLTDIADDFDKAKIENFRKNDIIRVCVLDVDKSNKRITLSTRPSRVFSSTLVAKDPEIQTIASVNVGDIRRGFVKNVSDKGLFVTLGGNVTGWVKVSDLSDSFLKEWKGQFKVDQLVQGKIIAVDQTLGHIQMSMRPSVISGKAKKQLALSEFKEGQIVTGRVKNVAEYGVFIAVDGSANVSGLCHKSQMADGKVEDVAKLYAEGDPVKAKVLAVDVEKRRISFGLKASYFQDGDEESGDEDGGMEIDGSDGEDEDDESDGGINLEEVKDFGSEEDSDAESVDSENDSDVEMSDAPEEGLTTTGFDWTGNVLDKRDHDSDADSDSSSGDEHKKKKRRRGASAIKQDLTGDMASRDPQSVSDFERLLLGTPNDSRLWIQYMAFQLQLSEVEKAREIAERALKTIALREEKEKLNIWIAMLNTENTYGNDEGLEEVFKRACQYNDAQEVHEKLASIYIQSGKSEKAEALFKVMLKKFSQSPSIWTNYADFLLTSSDRTGARELLKRAMQALPKLLHRDLIIQFAKLEFRTGDPERGRTLFETLLGTYNKKMDLYNVFLDMEIKYSGEEVEGVRGLFKRALAEKCSVRQAKGLFKKWREWEEKRGDAKGVEEVTRRAKEFVEKRTGEEEK